MRRGENSKQEEIYFSKRKVTKESSKIEISPCKKLHGIKHQQDKESPSIWMPKSLFQTKMKRAISGTPTKNSTDKPETSEDKFRDSMKVKLMVFGTSSLVCEISTKTTMTEEENL